MSLSQQQLPSPPSRPSMNRSNSTLKPHRPIHIPVPPSLLRSPHLESPHSIFRSAYSANKAPGEDEERWLGDTIPQRSQQEPSSTIADSRQPQGPTRSVTQQTQDETKTHQQNTGQGGQRRGSVASTRSSILTPSTSSSTATSAANDTSASVRSDQRRNSSHLRSAAERGTEH